MELTWDIITDRNFESGLDKGVLYLPDGSAVPWNGLLSVDDASNTETTPVYFDGMKIQDSVVLGDSSGTLKALTYPDEFVQLEGQREIRPGLWITEQMPIPFGLCYRTRQGNGSDPEEGYKIHIHYNVTAIVKDKTYATSTDQLSLTEFEWDLITVPVEYAGYRPSSHVILNSKDMDPFLLEEIEDMLYGSEDAPAYLPTITELATYIDSWYRWLVVDNGDGTWTATTPSDDLIVFTDPGETEFELQHIDAAYLDDVTYTISDTSGSLDPD